MLLIIFLCLFYGQSIKTDHENINTIRFDIKEVMNMHGSADLMNSTGGLIKSVEIKDGGLIIGDISVSKNKGVYLTVKTGSDQRFLSFNPSLSQINDFSEDEVIYKKKSMPKNGILWKSRSQGDKFAQTIIDKGQVIISVENIEDDLLLAMILMERIHHARSLLIANSAFF
ncbi:hypothetical protein MM236_16290 [Belliella sp. DSM 107340]|uniref:Uncharacterized protein n=1 Tax=Belliella calami TaxID=2923436 RepID=A0ABS9UT02_9BACT|nr:hypothetical protein [Belliella calami]MCH7399564.1 hypothetical protein [Belliella calami]